MGDLVHNPSIGDTAVEELLSQWQDKPRMVAFVRALMTGGQAVEDLAYFLIVDRTIDSATGAQLDQWGSIVGEPRLGLLDNDYRRFIRARILVNNCPGTTDALITLYKLVMSADAVFERATPPAAFILYAHRATHINAQLTARAIRIMRDAKPMGIRMQLMEITPGYFGFSTNPDASGLGVGRLSRQIM